jgi:hypothetical protein
MHGTTIKKNIAFSFYVPIRVIFLFRWRIIVCYTNSSTTSSQHNHAQGLADYGALISHEAESLTKFAFLFL